MAENELEETEEESFIDPTLSVQHKRASKEEWKKINPTLKAGEIGFETDTGRIKVGDGIHSWYFLSYVDETDVKKKTTSGLYVYSHDSSTQNEIKVSSSIIQSNVNLNSGIPTSTAVAEMAITKPTFEVSTIPGVSEIDLESGYAFKNAGNLSNDNKNSWRRALGIPSVDAEQGVVEYVTDNILASDDLLPKWYRRYGDGWLEQGGEVRTNELDPSDSDYVQDQYAMSGLTSINIVDFKTSFADDKYEIILTQRYTANQGNNYKTVLETYFNRNNELNGKLNDYINRVGILDNTSPDYQANLASIKTDLALTDQDITIISDASSSLEGLLNEVNPIGGTLNTAVVIYKTKSRFVFASYSGSSVYSWLAIGHGE